MKFKLSTIALAGLCAASGAAQAAIELSGLERPTSEMVFVAYDPVNQVTYARDLGTMVSEFNFSQLYNRQASTLEGFDTFLGMVDLSVTRWGIVASDSSAPVSTYYTASRFLNGSSNPNHARVVSINNAMASFFNAHNASYVGNHAGVADGWSISTTAGIGQGSALFGAGHNLGSNIVASALLNAELSFYAFTNPTTTGSTRSRLGNSFAPVGFSVDVQANNLVFVGELPDLPPADPYPLPEPGTYALMLAGLATLGAVARRRRA